MYYLKDAGSLWMTANMFGIHQSTVTKVCSAINTVLGPKYIYLPRNKDECIDGMHVALKHPPENSQDFYNYKQFFSLNVQAVCDSNGQFMDVECRWLGSVHDAKVFANSSICKNLNNGQLSITYIPVLPGCSAVPNYLIGNPAYPLIQFCISSKDDN